jgi:hypothetical protein
MPNNLLTRLKALNYLDPDWKVAHKLWSVRVALFWAAMSGLWVAFPAFQGFVSPVQFALLSITFSLIMCIARLTNQPGLS